MTNETFLALAVLVPIAGALIIPFIGRRNPALRGIIAFGLISISFACSLALAPTVFAGIPVQFSLPFSSGSKIMLYEPDGFSS